MSIHQSSPASPLLVATALACPPQVELLKGVSPIIYMSIIPGAGSAHGCTGTRPFVSSCDTPAASTAARE